MNIHGTARKVIFNVEIFPNPRDFRLTINQDIKPYQNKKYIETYWLSPSLNATANKKGILWAGGADS
jgi:hypothetical protein